MPTVKLFRFVLPVALASLLVGCGTMMKDVIAKCDTGQNFDAYASCIKSTYSKEGRRPNDTTVRAFYANLDVIAEAYRDKKISDAQAKALSYDAFMRTVQADNDRADAAFQRSMNALSQMPQSTFTPTPNRSVQTTCTRFGNTVNCSSN